MWNRGIRGQGLNDLNSHHSTSFFGVIRLCIMALSFCTKDEINHLVFYVFTCTVYLIVYQIPLFILFSF